MLTFIIISYKYDVNRYSAFHLCGTLSHLSCINFKLFLIQLNSLISFKSLHLSPFEERKKSRNAVVYKINVKIFHIPIRMLNSLTVIASVVLLLFYFAILNKRQMEKEEKTTTKEKRKKYGKTHISIETTIFVHVKCGQLHAHENTV